MAILIIVALPFFGGPRQEYAHRVAAILDDYAP